MKKNDQDFYISELISKLLTGEITPLESELLKQWSEESDTNRLLFEKLTNPTHLQDQLEVYNSGDPKQAWEKFQGKLNHQGWQTQFKYRNLLKYAALLLLLSSVAILLIHPKKPQTKKIAFKATVVHQTIDAGTNHAILILGNGQKITLKKFDKLSLKEKDGTAVSNQNHILSYERSDQTPVGQQQVYNTVIVPRGGEYQLILADGSKIWMNSASTLRYPTAFSGKERRVYLTGEAYFEVAKNAKMPFIVKTTNTEVQVLGTHFNVKAYDDESDCKTTLLEGSVRVQSVKAVNIIKPGQQAIINSIGQQKVVSDIDVEEEIAWKNGLFVFKDADIASIMQEAARWYDLKVVYAGKIPKILFSGKMSRKVDFYGFINILKYAGVHFEMNGRTVIVTQ